MDLEPYLREHPDVFSVTKRPGLVPTYLVFIDGAGYVRVTHVPAKRVVPWFLFAHELAGNDIKSGPWVFIAATKWHERGLIRMRVDQGLREAKHQLKSRA